MKRLEPNVWAMTGGSVVLGENSVDTIVRETKEENWLPNLELEQYGYMLMCCIAITQYRK